MYSYEKKVGYSATDETLTMTVPAILDSFEDASIFEAEDGYINMAYLSERHLAWLLGSWKIVIERRPKLNEKIKITTAPYDFKGFLGCRCFTLSGEDGSVIVKAASIWTLIDTAKMCPVKLTQEMIDGYELTKIIDLEYTSRKIPLLGEGTEGERFTVRNYQIDSNRHMNNVEYVKLAMESLPDHAVVRELRTEYKKAARLGDQMISKVYRADDKWQVVLQDDQDEIFAIVEFILETKERKERSYE